MPGKARKQNSVRSVHPSKLFAFANAGVPIEAGAFTDSVAMAVVVGLCVGKPVGIVLISWLVGNGQRECRFCFRLGKGFKISGDKCMGCKIDDSVLIQPVVSGNEYRVFLLDDAVAYSARKYPPFVRGDGESSIRDLLKVHNAALRLRGLSPVAVDAADAVLPRGERFDIPGRMNLSAGGTMVLEAPDAKVAFALASKAVLTLGLRVAAVDLFTGIGGDREAIRVIEVNANPSIRLLEESNRGDLILRIWRDTFRTTGLLGV